MPPASGLTLVARAAADLCGLPLLVGTGIALCVCKTPRNIWSLGRASLESRELLRMRPSILSMKVLVGAMSSPGGLLKILTSNI